MRPVLDACRVLFVDARKEHEAGPSYTTPIPDKKGVPYKLDLDPVNSAVVLAYQVCA
ncbi:MAG: hypothetical protein ABSB24_06800 [Gaiellaceae bacterium]